LAEANVSEKRAVAIFWDEVMRWASEEIYMMAGVKV
jgi:hypothetical protein